MEVRIAGNLEKGLADVRRTPIIRTRGAPCVLSSEAAVQLNLMLAVPCLGLGYKISMLVSGFS